MKSIFPSKDRSNFTINQTFLHTHNISFIKQYCENKNTNNNKSKFNIY